MLKQIVYSDGIPTEEEVTQVKELAKNNGMTLLFKKGSVSREIRTEVKKLLKPFSIDYSIVELSVEPWDFNKAKAQINTQLTGQGFIEVIDKNILVNKELTQLWAICFKCIMEFSTLVVFERKHGTDQESEVITFYIDNKSKFKINALSYVDQAVSEIKSEKRSVSGLSWSGIEVNIILTNDLATVFDTNIVNPMALSLRRLLENSV